VIGCSELVVFKSLYSRTRDWADIEAIMEAGAIDCADTLARVERLLGTEHPSAVRLRDLCPR
jgi:hypothetical protein